MMTERILSAALALPLLLGVLAAGGGCAGRHAVYASTGTTLGVEISQNPSTQMYQAKLGYNRAELAVVPSNRNAGEETGQAHGGARDTTDVLMELRYSGMLSTGADSGVYQRLAVGRTAVSQPGAAFMMAKAPDGTLDATTAMAVSRSIQSIPQVDPAAESSKVPLGNAYAAASEDQKRQFDAVVAPRHGSFGEFLVDTTTTPQQVQAIARTLKERGLIP